MTPDQERWAEAPMVRSRHGDEADAHVAERIVALTQAGNQAGVARWLAIGERLEQLLRPGARA